MFTGVGNNTSGACFCVYIAAFDANISEVTAIMTRNSAI